MSNLFGKLLVGTLFLTLGACLLVLPQFAASPAGLEMNGLPPRAQVANEPTPAFHDQPPQDVLPPTMEPALFTETQTYNAYLVAGRIKKVLYQQPCYCHCDQSQGHGSLLDCYLSRHATECDICQREDFYAYEQTHKGQKPSQIREGIMHGEWQNLDTSKYARARLPQASTPAK